MICGEDEIGLGNSHDGIMVLDGGIEAGRSVRELYNITEDYSIEIGLTPNRADGFSHYGVARDIAAVLNLKSDISMKSIEYPDLVSKHKASLEVEVEDFEKCPRYAGVEIKNLRIEPSPEWLQNRLKVIGLSPLNNVVDITNYINHEIGQPLHAFDADQIGGKRIVVRKAHQGEKFISLDEKERELDVEDLMICDDEKGMCIGGVFGGIESGVSESTKHIFFGISLFQSGKHSKKC